MAEASVLSLKPKRKDINKYRELDDEWYSLGTELEIDDEELDELKEKFSNDPHMRLIKMFGVWLEKGENPTYRKLVEAMVEIDKKDIAQSICTKLGLTSSLDNLLSTSSQTKLPECSPIPDKETDTNIGTPAPVSDQSPQKTTPSEHVQIKSPDTCCACDQPMPLTDFSQVENDSAHVSIATDHSEGKNEQLLTDSLHEKSVVHDTNAQIKSPTACHTGDQPIPLPDSSHEEQANDDSAHTYKHSEVKIERSFTDSSPQKSIAHDVNLQAKNISVTNDQTLTFSHQELATKNRTVDHSELKNERSLTDSSPHQETGTKPNRSQGITSSDPDFTRSQSKGDLPHISYSTHHSRSKEKSTSTVPCDSETSSQSGKVQNVILPSDASARDSQMHEPMTSAAVGASSELAYKAMIHCHDKLVTALSSDIVSISGILVANEFIPPEVSSKMLLPTLTPQEKATSLVIAITEQIKLAPDRFQELIKIFSEQTCTKVIVTQLSSHVKPKQVADDRGKENVGVIVSTDQQHAVCEDRMYTAWASLDPDDKTDLEARLLTDAERIGVKFAHLCSMARDSFEQRGITPQMLADTLMDLTVFKPGSSFHGIIPLLKEDGMLTKAQSVRDTFHALRPHMSFFNNEILEFIIERKGSEEDKVALTTFLVDFKEFCKRHVFEVPFNNGSHFGDHRTKQRLHIKVTEHFKAAFLIESTSETLSSTSVCSSKLGINLEDAKNIQRKFASILGLNPSSLFLDSISEGSVILTFLLPTCVSLTGLDNNPEITRLSSNGISILCGPPSKLKLIELTQSGMIMRWSQPEYGYKSLTRYTVYYRKKGEGEANEWQKFELGSLETHTCVPGLSDGETYVFKICTVSDVGTLQYSNESDPIVMSADGILTNNIHKVIVANKDTLTSAFSSADPNKIALQLSVKGIISKQDEIQISQASTPSEKATLIVTTIDHRMKSSPEKFQDFLSALSKANSNIVETLWSDYYDSVYKQYLDYLYASLDKKNRSSNQWPPSATKKFFRLAMIKTAAVQRELIKDKFVQMTITGKVDDILQHKYPIRLENVFKETEHHQRESSNKNEGQRKVILLEGAPGCGKSTLSVYICQQWEKGQLFNQFKLAILIPLRDPEVKHAESLADLLPCSNTKRATLLAGIMEEMKCQDVLFILDGWDELTMNLRTNSIFYDLVNPELDWSNPLSRSTVIVTSRPVASGDLHRILSSRVEILGFTAEELHEFFIECLKGDTEAVKTLLERIEENPEVAGSCYLPLNATILVHLFKSDRNTLPTTLYGIFSSLVLNCIKRHLKLRTQYKDVSIESLDQLPEFAKKPFSVLCRLAYDGVMEDKIIFTSLPVDINTLSLLQGVESFIGRKKAVSHNFLHLSIQELLAAWYIAKQLPANEQVSEFNELFDKSRFSAIFRFYAAITELRTPGIKDVVIRIARSSDKLLLISLLHCLYEAQDPSLCVSVAQQLQQGLDLWDTTLTPSDCLCIGYFLAHVCKMAAGKFGVNLGRCSIGDQGCKYLVGGLHKYLDTHSAVTTLLRMDMDNNAISHHGVLHLSTLLKFGCTFALDLFNNDSISNLDAFHKRDRTHSCFGTFAELLKSNTTLKELNVERCGLDSQSAESLAESLATNKHLEVLHISHNALCDDGIQQLAHALRVNQGLKNLWLVNCGMTDVGLECLAKSLQHSSLTQLHTYSNENENENNPNRLTEKIVPVLIECLQ